MTQMVTRCPKCATAFRITSTQLESAKGAVRCGSCLHIFKAQDYLVKTTNPQEPVAIKKPEPQVTKPAAKAEQLKPEQFKTEQLPLEQPTIATPTKVDTKPLADTTAVSSVQTPSAAKAAPIQAQPSTFEAETPTTKPVIDKAKVLEDEDDVLISDDMDQETQKDSTYEFDGFLDLDMRPKQTVSLFEREIRYEAPHEDQDEPEDESWAEELLDDNEEVLHQLKKPAPPIVKTEEEEFAESYGRPEEVVSEELKPEAPKPYSGLVFSLVDESPNPQTEESKDQPKQEHQEETVFSQEFLNATNSPQAKEERAAEAASFAAALFNPNASAAEAEQEEDKPSSKRPVKSSKIRAFDTSRAALLMNIMPAPVEFTAKRMRRWYQRKLWSSLSFLMAFLLFFQVAYFKFDYFSRVEPYRTAYLFVCPIFGCDVPTLIDTSQILATNLIVRNHPEAASALMVDAILINNAPFEQPFPDLTLSFSKLDETPVATRRFTPAEYLAGELAGMKHIPVRQPVHITIEIADPGPEAVNYSLLTH